MPVIPEPKTENGKIKDGSVRTRSGNGQQTDR